MITEFRVWNYALTKKQVKSLYKHGDPDWEQGISFIDWFGIISWGTIFSILIIGWILGK